MISEESPAPECTSEALFAGRLSCRQHRRGYRFSHDPVLLAHSFDPSPAEHIIDLGTGCGIIALILAWRRPDLVITGLELQGGLAALARGNVEDNGLAGRVTIVPGDLRQIRDLFPPGSFDRVVSNPPYRPLGAARSNPDREKAAARHELTATSEDVLHAANWLLADGGRVDLVYPAERCRFLLDAMGTAGFAAVRLREVYSYPAGPCRLVLVEGVKGGREEIEMMPPLFVQTGPTGGYTPEMEKFYEP